MLFLFVSLACFALFAAVFAATFTIDHFASAWEETGAGSWRRRFSAWANASEHLDAVKGLSGLASAVACLAFLVAFFYDMMFGGIGVERRFALYLTGGHGAEAADTLRQFYATSRELDRMPIFEYVDNRRIVKGRVSSVLPIGGGLTHVCVASGQFCGLADSSLELKPGDTAFIRIGRPSASRRRPPGWAITEDESKSLAASAKFTIEEK